MSSSIVKPQLLKPKHHFEILDGLRGVAALCVVVFHFMEMVYVSDKNFIAHGFLAVDFFFCLSGFVIAYAYDDRIGSMGIVDFFKRRIIRLHPLVIFGTVLGLLSFLFDPFSHQAGEYSVGKIILIFISSILLIPFPSMTERSFNLFGLNAPAWSLFWEYVANILYALFLHKLNRKLLFLLTIVAGLTLAFVGFRAKSLLGGWDGSSFWDGGARIFYSFLVGMLIYRSNWLIKSKLGFVVLAILLVFAFITPAKWGWISELVVVLFYFPLLVSLGAGAILSPKLKKICVFSGNISYPLYMTHYVAIWVFYNYYQTYKPATEQLIMVIITGVVLLVGLAYIVMVSFDIPIRNYLTQKWKKAK